MDTILLNDWYMATNHNIGAYTLEAGEITQAQKHNVLKIYSYLSGIGWTINAIAGILGNMMRESSINPAFIQETNRWRLPNGAANLEDVPNSVMINFHMDYYHVTRKAFGIGTAQWDGDTPTPPPGQKLVSFAERYNLNWYDGDTQMFRLQREWEENIQFLPVTIQGHHLTFDEYVHSELSPEVLARIWQASWERSEDWAYRSENARYWFNWLKANAGLPAWLKVVLFSKRRGHIGKRIF